MTLRIYESRFRHATQAPDGTVGRWLGRKMKEIETVAKVIATEEGLVRTGRYRASIIGLLITDGGGLAGEIGSQVSHARLLERGTPEHFVRPHSKKALWWDMPNDRGWMVQPDDGRPVSVVLHPGTRPYMVLHRAILQVLRGGV